MSEELSFEVAENLKLGRYIVASKDINIGDIILEEHPLLIGPSQTTGPVCLSCLQGITADNSVECLTCGWPLCKSDQCQVGSKHLAECDWTTRKRQQKVKIKQFITPHPTYECITVLRCLYQKENNPGIWEKLMRLESHCDSRKESEKYQSDKMVVVQLLYRFFKINENEFSENDILKACGIIQVNGHEMPLTEPPHVAIYELASMLEHNCVPNCCKTFTGDGNLIIRATKSIKKGEHISICYTDPCWSTINRLEHLAVTKYFYCECERCTDPTELGTFYSALKCFEKNCDGYIIPHVQKKKSCLPHVIWKCNIDDKELEKTKVNDILTNIAHDYTMTDKRKIKSCELFLNHYNKKDLLHKNHYFLTDVRLKLAQLYGQVKDCDIQSLSDEQLDYKTILCKQSISIANILFPAEWRIHGSLQFEMHASVAEKARREMVNGKIGSVELREKLLESKRWLEEALFCLKYEPEILPEGKMARQAQTNLIDLENLLRRIHVDVPLF